MAVRQCARCGAVYRGTARHCVSCAVPVPAFPKASRTTANTPEGKVAKQIAAEIAALLNNREKLPTTVERKDPTGPVLDGAEASKGPAKSKQTPGKARGREANAALPAPVKRTMSEVVIGHVARLPVVPRKGLVACPRCGLFVQQVGLTLHLGRHEAHDRQDSGAAQSVWAWRGGRADGNGR